MPRVRGLVLAIASRARGTGAGRRRDAQLRFARATSCRPSCAYRRWPFQAARGVSWCLGSPDPAGLGSSAAACPLELPATAPPMGIPGVRFVRTALLLSGASGIRAPTVLPGPAAVPVPPWVPPAADPELRARGWCLRQPRPCPGLFALRPRW